MMRQFTSQDLDDIRTHFPLQDCLPPPDLTITRPAAERFEALYQATLQKGPAAQVEYDLPYPKYLFLEYLAQEHGVMLHGSPLANLETIKPIRQSRDSSEFGDQAAIYATQDPLWVLFFAVLNKSVLQGMIMNGAIQLRGANGDTLRRYFYCLDCASLSNHPWQPGAVYILPGDGFDADPTLSGARYGEYEVICTHWIKRGELVPLACLPVEPMDFPYLGRVWGYDPQSLQKRLEEPSIAGWPFLSDRVIYPIHPNATQEG